MAVANYLCFVILKSQYIEVEKGEVRADIAKIHIETNIRTHERIHRNRLSSRKY